MEPIAPDAVWLRPGQLAGRAGVAVSTLHYYESLGLISSRRTAGDRREYRRDTLRVVAFVRASQRLGISLARIKAALDDLPHDEPPTTRDWARLAREWRDDLTRPDRRADRAAGQPVRVHRVRLPLADVVPHRQPARPAGSRGARREAAHPQRGLTRQVRWSKSPLAQPMWRSAERRTISLASAAMTLAKLP